MKPVTYRELKNGLLEPAVEHLLDYYNQVIDERTLAKETIPLILGILDRLLEEMKGKK
jgi:hypothetical protein